LSQSLSLLSCAVLSYPILTFPLCPLSSSLFYKCDTSITYWSTPIHSLILSFPFVPFSHLNSLLYTRLDVSRSISPFSHPPSLPYSHPLYTIPTPSHPHILIPTLSIFPYTHIFISTVSTVWTFEHYQAKNRDVLGQARVGIEPLPEPLDADYLTACYEKAK
jgi:hypothetical protein